MKMLMWDETENKYREVIDVKDLKEIIEHHFPDEAVQKIIEIMEEEIC